MEFLEQPFLTEEGFVNPACMNELEQWIKKMPKPHEGLTNDPEWTTPRITHLREITAALAYWAIKQIGSGKKETGIAHAPNLEKVIGYLHAAIRSKFDHLGYAELSLCDISKLLYDILYQQNISIFDDWNTKECLGDYWLDLNALLRNVCLTIRSDRREFDAFNKDFEEKYSKLEN